MINSKKDLKEYIQADKSKYNLRHSCLFRKIIQTEAHCIVRYLKCLRHLEYHINCTKSKSLYGKLMYAYYSVKESRLSAKYKIRIQPNVVGKGLYIPHFTGGIIINAAKMGENCIVNTGVVIGIKGSQQNKPEIGDNVEITVGAKIIGKIKIGNNVAIAPNSVVIGDVPDNAIVSGVPAKIIKIKNNN